MDQWYRGCRHSATFLSVGADARSASASAVMSGLLGLGSQPRGWCTSTWTLRFASIGDMLVAYMCALQQANGRLSQGQRT